MRDDDLREDEPEDFRGDGVLAEGEAPEPPRRRWRLRRILAAVLLLFLLLFAWLAITAPLSKSLQPIAAPSITLVSAEGEPIARRGALIEAPVKVSDLPGYVPQAFVAIEDRRFYHHLGVDPRGIARAAWHNMRAGGVREGGSTITQQLAKLSFLSADRTAGRKAQEVLIAFWIEAWLKKDDILGRYLSNVYFGDNVYGLRAAAHHYFSRDPEDLSIAQAAMLAGLVKAPSRLAPTSNLSGARARAKLVIAAMVRNGAISASAAAGARPARLHVEPLRDLPTGTYFADWVLPQARASGESGYGEQDIQTTLESRIQRAAIAAVRRAPLGGAQVALVAMHPDGRVVAMIGGKDYAKSPFNRATQALRQPGSTFKLFVYLAALRAGMEPDTMISNAPLTVGDWSPKNSHGSYGGLISLREAFARSSNVAAVRLSEQVGRDKVIRAARDLGISSPLTDRPSLALGTSGVTLLELTSAYAAIAANSYPVKARGMPEVKQSWYDSFWSHHRPFGSHVLPALLDLLYASANEGTGRAAALRVKTYGKTGTTQDNRDAIFVGFAGDLVAAVWVGNDDNRPLGGIAGGGLPARIWRDFMARAIDSTPRAAAVAAPALEPEARFSIDPDNSAFTVDIPMGDNAANARVTVDLPRFDDQPSPDDQDDEPPPAEEDEDGGEDQ